MTHNADEGKDQRGSSMDPLSSSRMLSRCVLWKVSALSPSLSLPPCVMGRYELPRRSPHRTGGDLQRADSWGTRRFSLGSSWHDLEEGENEREGGGQLREDPVSPSWHLGLLSKPLFLLLP